MVVPFQPPQQTRPRGFDALLDAGLTRTEIDQMRRQFYAGRGEEVPDGLDAGMCATANMVNCQTILTPLP
jgi:hypothetical protein